MRMNQSKLQKIREDKKQKTSNDEEGVAVAADSTIDCKEAEGAEMETLDTMSTENRLRHSRP